VNKNTIVKISSNLHGRDCVWHESLNLVELSDRLDAAGRRRALTELQREWLDDLLTLPESA
jgi:hypothetical protein